MLKIIYATMILAVLSLYSQPTMNQGNLPQIGTEANFIFYEAENLEHGPSGANQTWDFSNLKESADQTGTHQEFVAASEGWQSSQFPGATFAETTDTAYTYYKLDNNKLIRLGTGFEEGAEVLTNDQLQYQIPFTYGDSYTDDFAGTTYVQGYEADRDGTISTEADAYGTITVGTNTYTNTLRIKSYIEIVDVVQMEVQGFPITATITSKLTSYSWLLEGEYYPVFSMTEGTISTEASGMSFDQDVKNAYGVAHTVEVPTLSTPEILSPENGAKNVTAPVTLTWTESDIIMQGKPNLSENDVKYIVNVLEIRGNDMFEYNDTVSTNSIIYDTLKPDYLYQWQVKAFTDNYESDWSEKSTFFAASQTTPPAKPVLSTPENNAENIGIEPYFSWEDANDADSWTIVVDDNPQFSIPITEKTVNVSIYELKATLDHNKTYYWRVKAMSGEMESEWSDVWSFSTTEESVLPETPMPSSPPNNATEISITPTLEWAEDANATKYNLVVADNAQLATIILDTDITTNSYTFDEDLSDETTYFWAVRAGNENGWSQMSDVYSFTTENTSSVIYRINNDNIKIMPNPASDYFEITYNNIPNINKADIININGIVSQNIDINDLKTGRVKLNNLSSGKYFIRIQADKNYIVPLIIK